jgi:Domain of unknown function (DUF4279)
MVAEEQAVRIGREEVAKQWLGTTQQILAVNSVVTEDGQPRVARVSETTSPGRLAVWFPLHDQAYFLVVFVESDRDGNPVLSGSCWHARVRVWLAIHSADVPPSEVTARTGLSPTEEHERGDLVRVSSKARYKSHIWQLEPQREVPGTVDEKLSLLLRQARPAAQAIAGLRPSCDVEVGIVYDGWGGAGQFGGWHVDGASLQGLAELGADIDIDMYALGPRMPG